MRRSVGLCLMLLFFVFASLAHADTPFQRWSELHGAVASWRLDSLRVARVQSLLLVRDAGAIVFEEGRLALARPLGGRVCAAAFEGRGSFSYTPRGEVERAQLQRVYGRTTLRRSFTNLVMVFDDSTAAELMGSLTFSPETLGTLRRAWRELEPHLTERENQVLRPLPVAFALANRDSGLFWASIWSAGQDPLYLIEDPYANESIQLHRRPEDDRRGLYRNYGTEVVSQQVPEGVVDTLRSDVRPPFRATHHALHVSIGADLKANVRAEITVQAEGRPCEWLPFALHPRLRLQRVLVGDQPLEFHQEKFRNSVWVRVAPALEPGVPRVLRFEYSGEMFGRLEDDWIALLSTSDWYPRTAFTVPATWDLDFTYPSRMQLLASGQRTEDRTDGALRHSRWVQSRPTPLASFDLGYFRGIEVANDSLPSLTVWAHHVDGAGKVVRRTLPELAASRRYDDQVALDVARAVLSMQRVNGPALAPVWNAVETPRLRFEAFPGLVHLMPLSNKRLPGAQYSPELYRYHEIAHQWWGLGVRPAGYRDVWLAEGFASFMSIYHPATALSQPAVRSTVLSAWREEIQSGRRYLFVQGQEAGPIALGTRVHSSATPGDHEAILSMKGAWVVERLRCALRGEDGSDARFESVLRTFSQRYAGLPARTEDFLRVAEEVTGTNLHPFFQRYVYGTEELDFTPCP